MKPMIMKSAIKFKNMITCQDGIAAVEFVVAFPLVILIVFMSLENSILNVEKGNLDHALEVSIHELKTRSMINPSGATLHSRICELMDNGDACNAALTVEMRVFDTTSTSITVPSVTATCGASSFVAPDSSSDLGISAANRFILVRACYEIDVMFPFSALGDPSKALGDPLKGGYNFESVRGTEHRLISTTAFAYEPA